ncbi:MAG TPA: UDP-N-acetylmuramoyl-L-alanine--D-glutamate ligase [Longimicrobiales bacterium]
MTQLIGVLGLARSGRAAALLALAAGDRVFASDASASAEAQDAAAAVRQAGGERAEAETGAHTIERLAQCDVLVLSPGIPPDAPVLGDPRLAGIPRISELEFAFRQLASPVIGITGTNGKSTVTALTAHLLKTAGFNAPAAGNIGLALSEVALRHTPPDWAVVECSSFQLADIDCFNPRIGVLTNLAPDHLDRYPSVEAYYADKQRLFKNAGERSSWVLNGEDDAVLQLAGDAPGRRYLFRASTVPPAGEQGAFVADGSLVLRMAAGEADVKLIRTDELRILGQHNVANALTAALAAALAGAPEQALRDGLRSFGGLEHRLEVVLEHEGVLWINDSKATNVASTLVALRGVPRPTILLLGGRHKGEPYTHLLPALQNVKVVVAYGEAAPIVVQDLADRVAVERVDGSFEAVVARAAALARPGDAILLSPACSSYDMFANYEERGRRFKDLAQETVGGAGAREVAHGA